VYPAIGAAGGAALKALAAGISELRLIIIIVLTRRYVGSLRLWFEDDTADERLALSVEYWLRRQPMRSRMSASAARSGRRAEVAARRHSQ